MKMSVLDDDICSVVSGSTNMTDNTTCNLQITDLFENHKIFPGREKDPSRNSVQDIYTKPTGVCEMSPLIPLQVSKFTQKSVAMEDSGSEMSELLKPVTSMKSAATANTSCTTCFEIQESQFPEESQSLLPQLPVSSPWSTVPGKDGEGNNDTRVNLSRNENDADPSQSSVSSTVMSNEQSNYPSKAQEILRNDAEDSRCPGMTVKVKSPKNKSCVPESSVFKSIDLLDKTKNLSEHTCRSKKSDNLWKLQTQAMRETPDLQKEQEMICKMQNNINLSQSQSLLSGREGEFTQMSQSQGTVTLTSQGKDPVDRIISRLDRLVSSLDKVPRRQMMVIEATVLQCITSLQDSLNNKLKKQSSTGTGTGTLRKLLQTTQNGLTKLTEQHKNEKLQISTQSTQQTDRSQQNQSGVNDLGNRQKKVLDLLRRQKYLVELYKTKNRPTSERIISDPAHSDKVIQKIAERKTTGNKLESHQETKRFRRGRQRTTSAKGVIKTTSVKSEKRRKSIELQLKDTQDSSSLKEVVSHNIKDIDYDVNAQVKDVSSKTESEDQLNTELQSTELENCAISQDLTTVPDTQDLSTQDTFRASVKDSSKARSNLAFDKVSADHAEFVENSDEGRKILNESGCKNETGTGVSSRKDDNLTNNKKDTYDATEMKGEEMIVTESNEEVKTIGLNVEECANNAVEPKDKVKVSEILWLNMLRDYNDKPVERNKETVPLKGPNQELFTATKMDDIKELPIRKDTVCDADFIFRKPSLIDNTTLKESYNAIAVPNEERKIETCLNRKTKVFDDETRQNELGNRIQENDDTNGKNGKIINGLSSPPNVIHPGETWHNVSPTATSMSSDVFMVKMKDLQKRMKRKNMQLEQTEEILPLNAASKKYDSKDVHVHRQRISDQDDVTEELGRDNKNVEICNEDPKKVHDTISEAIDSVIEQSRLIAARQKTEDIKELENIQTSEGAYRMGSERYSENSQSECQKRLTASLPTLRDLVCSGKLVPGKAVLSCHLEGKTYRASLTPLGKIRTQEGLVFTTASQWVSTLTDGTQVKKRKAYEMVFYQNRQLLSFCKARPGCAYVPSIPTPIAKEVHLQPIPKPSVDQGVQVEESELISLSSKMTEDERRLSELLSNSVIRLLTEQDLVPCDDLPDNFWTEDFSKVKLHKDTWDAVDAW